MGGHNQGFAAATGRSLAMTLASEIGDETFIMAAILAMQHPRGIILAASLSALWLMTMLSATFGFLLPQLLSPELTSRIATVLYFVFSARLLWIGLHSSDDVLEEIEEVEKELGAGFARSPADQAVSEAAGGDEDDDEVALAAPRASVSSSASRRSSQRRSSRRRSSAASVAEAVAETKKRVSMRRMEIPVAEDETVVGSVLMQANRLWEEAYTAMEPVFDEVKIAVDPLVQDIQRSARPAIKEARKLLTPTFVETFIIVFLAEWGDRSQISTITLASDASPLGVTLGGMIGHAICTSIAVWGGRLLASQISQRTVALSGSAVFLVFGLLNVAKLL